MLNYPAAILQQISVSPAATLGKISEARRLAGAILEAARSDAERIIAEAREHSVRLCAESEKMGFADGIARAAGELLRAADAAKNALLKSEDRITGTAAAIAREVIGEEIRERPESIKLRVGEALALARNASTGTLRINPEDSASIELPPDFCISLRPDCTIERGSFILQTDLGEIRASLNEHLERLAAALLERRE